jgi:cell wall-associated NlpC family hydrolase
MTTRSDTMIAAARTCLGTPFHHQGRIPQQGLDCIGLIVVALQATNIIVQDRVDYARWPEAEALATALAAHGAVPVVLPEPGDILLFVLAGRAQHVALCTAHEQMIHAYAPAGKVVEGSIGAVWRRRLQQAYRFQES